MSPPFLCANSIPIHSLSCFLCPYSSPLLLLDPRLCFRPPWFFPSGLRAGPTPPEAGAGLSASPNPPTPLSLRGTGSSLPPPRALSAAACPGPDWLSPAPGSSSPRFLAPSAPRPLHLQLRLWRPRLRSRRDPHLPPSPGLIGRCLTTDPHNKTSGSEPRLPHLSHQSAAASAPTPSGLDQ